ncbi:MAG: sigma-70 family RNA polymerase sigma factor [Deltaproteobacteria bacterium]|nr:sigma-70 family RNA polymerase sigma factor [Deltaproteobacteria bacterium]
MRITPIAEKDGIAQLRVEGRVTQQTVEALQSSCTAEFFVHSTLLLELSGVQFVDAAGIEAFRHLVQKGAVLFGCSGFLTELLQITDAGEKGASDSAPADQYAHDAQLLARLRRGEEEAFEQLVRQYTGRLLAAARRLLGNEPDAQDAVQEAFLSACKAIGQFTGTAKLSTWLHRIVINAALMKLRSRRRKHEESIEDLLPRFDEQGEWSSQVAPWEISSDTLLQQQETRTLVRHCIKRLPDTYRTVLLLRDIEDLNTEEVAETLGITPNAVKIRLHRARQALRTLLEQNLVHKETYMTGSELC